MCEGFTIYQITTMKPALKTEIEVCNEKVKQLYKDTGTAMSTSM